MKIFFTTLAFLFLTTNSFAINLGDQLKQLGGDSGKEISGKVDQKLDKIVEKFEGEIDVYKKQVDGEVTKVRAQIKEAEDAVNKLKEIKGKAYYYINMVKIILAILGSGILVLIFVMWRIWRNIVGLKKVIRNVTNYDDINERLKKVEKALAAR